MTGVEEAGDPRNDDEQRTKPSRSDLVAFCKAASDIIGSRRVPSGSENSAVFAKNGVHIILSRENDLIKIILANPGIAYESLGPDPRRWPIEVFRLGHPGGADHRLMHTITEIVPLEHEDTGDVDPNTPRTQVPVSEMIVDSIAVERLTGLLDVREEDFIE